MIRNFKTGKLGLSDPEIDRERKDIFVAMCNRRGLDPNNCDSRIGTGRFYTPTEIHRQQVLNAMGMANTVLAYGGTEERWFRDHAWKYQAQEAWEHDGLGHIRKFGLNKVQNAAYALTADETRGIWEAQKERVSRATIVQGALDTEDGTFNGIRW